LIATFTDPFSEIAAVLVVAAVIGALAFWMRQPLIIALIFVKLPSDKREIVREYIRHQEHEDRRRDQMGLM
jgi:hypothetical protein